MKRVALLFVVLCVASGALALETDAPDAKASAPAPVQHKPHLKKGQLLPTNASQTVRELAIASLEELVAEGFANIKMGRDDSILQRYKRLIEKAFSEAKLQKLAKATRQAKQDALAKASVDDPLSKTVFKANQKRAAEIGSRIAKREKAAKRFEKVAAAIARSAASGTELFDALIAFYDAKFAKHRVGELKLEQSLVRARIRLYKLHANVTKLHKFADDTEDPEKETQATAKASSILEKIEKVRTRISQLVKNETALVAGRRPLQRQLRADQLGELAYRLYRRVKTPEQLERANFIAATANVVQVQANALKKTKKAVPKSSLADIEADIRAKASATVALAAKQAAEKASAKPSSGADSAKSELEQKLASALGAKAQK